MAYKYIQETFEKRDKSYGSPQWERLAALRKQPSVHRLERPTNIARARTLGYKAKPGYVMASSRIRRGTLRKRRPKMGRKNANLGVTKITPKLSLQRIAEVRAQKKFTNCEVLNSYKIGRDGEHHYFEVILVDRTHPVIQNDPNIKWITDKSNFRRVFRGKTSAGKKGRGQRFRKRGTERNFPSLRAKKNRGK